MMRKLSWLPPLVLMFFLVGCTSATQTQDDATAQNAALEQEVTELRQAALELQSQVNALQQEVIEYQLQATSAVPVTPAVVDQEPTQAPLVAEPAASREVFENDYMQMEIGEGWQYRAVGDSLNVTKDGYILFVNPMFFQASGVEGGRFAEIAQGAPGADLVINSWPAEPCQPVVPTALGSGLTRFDAYIGDTVADWCRRSVSGDEHWYFSYVSDGQYLGRPQAINPAIPDSLRRFVVTMTYDVSVSGQERSSNFSHMDLPVRGSAELAEAVAQMDAMVATLELR